MKIVGGVVLGVITHCQKFWWGCQRYLIDNLIADNSQPWNFSTARTACGYNIDAAVHQVRRIRAKAMEVTDDPVEAPPRSSTHDNGAVAVEQPRTELISRSEQERLRRIKQAQRDYGRGRKVNVKGVKDKKLRSNLKSLESKYKEAAVKAKDAEILLEDTGGFLEPETELERTYKVRQDDIEHAVSIETAKKRFDLKLDQLGPYVFDYSRNGRELLLGGRRGHVATMDWREGKLGCELQLGETVRDVRWLHNNQYFAVAQKKNVYIYDRNGVELHNLRKHREVTHMEFLPYHFLLATLVSDALNARLLEIWLMGDNRDFPDFSGIKTYLPAR